MPTISCLLGELKSFRGGGGGQDMIITQWTHNTSTRVSRPNNTVWYNTAKHDTVAILWCNLLYFISTNTQRGRAVELLPSSPTSSAGLTADSCPAAGGTSVVELQNQLSWIFFLTSLYADCHLTEKWIMSICRLSVYYIVSILETLSNGCELQGV